MVKQKKEIFYILLHPITDNVGDRIMDSFMIKKGFLVGEKAVKRAEQITYIIQDVGTKEGLLMSIPFGDVYTDIESAVQRVNKENKKLYATYKNNWDKLEKLFRNKMERSHKDNINFLEKVETLDMRIDDLTLKFGTVLVDSMKFLSLVFGIIFLILILINFVFI